MEVFGAAAPEVNSLDLVTWSGGEGKGWGGEQHSQLSLSPWWKSQILQNKLLGQILKLLLYDFSAQDPMFDFQGPDGGKKHLKSQVNNQSNYCSTHPAIYPFLPTKPSTNSTS